jgi:tRNA-splicing ligase RtcB
MRRRRHIADWATVLDCHADTVRIEHVLKPFAVIMAGPNEFDPYKD